MFLAKKEAKQIEKEYSSVQNKNRLKKIHTDINRLTFCKDYVLVIIDSNSQFDRANKGFYINGIKYKRLVGTTNGVKKNTIVYINDKIRDTVCERMECGRNSNIKLVPAKYEAYRSLICSASVPVSDPKGVLVVHDCITKFFDSYTKIDDQNSELPQLTQEEGEVELVDSDGYGLILPSKMKEWAEELGENYIPSGCCIRNAFCKGMLFCFDFIDFAEKVAGKYLVKDVWGQVHDIRDIEVILTESMLKLWDCYKSIDDYLGKTKKYHYHFAITKVTPKKLDDVRNMNYQFLQSYDFTDDEIKELLQPTVNEIGGVLGGDLNKTLLFLNGLDMNENYVKKLSPTFTKALMIESQLINDPYVKNKVQDMLKKRINNAKIGVIQVKGNYSIISGDPYSLCQSIFKMEVTGLLRRGQVYSKYWSDCDVDKIVGFRPPMTCHPNIRIFEVANTEEQQYWYRYMNTVTLFNSWDMASHALNGCD